LKNLETAIGDLKEGVVFRSRKDSIFDPKALETFEAEAFWTDVENQLEEKTPDIQELSDEEEVEDLLNFNSIEETIQL
jgi:hypothetical protein